MDSPTALNVLVTGAFGNIGRHVVRELAGRGHRVRAFDLPTAANQRAARGFDGVDVHWGDVRDAAAVQRAVAGQDAVAHLAFILPPLSERDPTLSRAVNVGGARNLVDALQARCQEARLVYASSYAIYGDTRRTEGLLTADSPVAPINH